MVWETSPVWFFCMYLSSFPITIYRMGCLFLIVCFCLLFCRLFSCVSVVSFLYSLFFSMDLVYVFMLVPYSLITGALCIVWNKRVWFLQPCSSFSNCLGYLKCFCFHINLRIICSSSVKTAIEILIGIALNLQITLDIMVILTILILLVHEHIISLHLFVLSAISFISFLYFSK